jgi:tetratricopeptide (TPR) repeat protein
VIDPVLGMPRDWDRFTALQLALGAAMLLILRDLRPVLSSTVAWRFSPPALALILVTTAAWLGVLSSEERTLARFATIQTYDTRGAEHLEETLAEHFHQRGEIARAINHVERAYELSGNPRYAVRTAIWYEEQGERALAYRTLRRVLERRPEHHDARFKLVQMLRADEDWNSLLEAARAGARMHPRSAIFAFFEGESLLHTNRRAEALDVFRRALTLDLPAPARAFIERTLAEENR